MIREYRVLGVANGALRHVAGGAIVLCLAPHFPVLLAGRHLMTLLAARPVERRALGFRRLRVRIVAGAAPEAGPAGPPAGPPLRLFEITGGVKCRGAGARATEGAAECGQQ